jgi:hypothetical protein
MGVIPNPVFKFLFVPGRGLVSKPYTIWIWEPNPYKILTVFYKRIWDKILKEKK